MAEDRKQGRLVPTLGLFSTTALIAGSMIGSGIFLLPASMMAEVQSPGLLLLIWIIGGLFTICGALTFAELASMFPKAGGQYVFLRESLGKPWSFLYGWSMFWIIQTGIIAAVAVAFARFTRTLFGWGLQYDVVVAVGCIAVLTLVNYFGVRFGGLVQNIFTVAKVGGILALVVLGFALENPPHALFDQTLVDAPTGFALFSAFFVAMLTGFFALDGWPQAAYVAPEIKNPTRTIPRAMIIGVLSVVTIYVLATAVFIHLLPLDFIVKTVAAPDSGLNIATEAARVFGGDTGTRLIAAAVMVSTFGTVNAYILTSPRVYYAAAKDGLFWWPFRKLHPQHNTPHVAMLYQGIWGGLLVTMSFFASDAYTAIVTALTFVIWAFYIPAVVGYFVLRRRRPDAARPYKTHFYPIVPLVFLLAAVVVVVNLVASDVYALATEPITTTLLAERGGLWGILFILTGAPFLLWWRARARRGEATPLAATTADRG